MRPCKFLAVLGLVVSGLLLAGCSDVWSVDPVRLEDPLGAAVSQTMTAQLYDPVAAAYPDPEPVERFDGYKANVVLRDYRNPILQRQRVQTFSINLPGIGGGSQ